MCDEIVEETKTVPTHFSEKVACKTQNFHILLAFLLVTIALSIAISVYCYLIKYQAKQKHLLPFNVKNDKSREFYTNKCIIKMKKMIN